MAGGSSESDALEELARITRRLRSECPWDREQDERSIVPHTVDESYELADAVARGDDEALLDELGDVLFQVYFLSLLMEEREAGSLALVARHCSEKLVRRHPHVFGDASRELDTDDVRRNWDRIKDEIEGRRGAGVFDDVPENLPALLWARKIQRRARSRGQAIDRRLDEVADDAVRELGRVRELAGAGASGGSEHSDPERGAIERAIGGALFALVDLARQVKVDPELALRAEARSYMEDFGSGQG